MRKRKAPAPPPRPDGHARPRRRSVDLGWHEGPQELEELAAGLGHIDDDFDIDLSNMDQRTFEPVNHMAVMMMSSAEVNVDTAWGFDSVGSGARGNVRLGETIVDPISIAVDYDHSSSSAATAAGATAAASSSAAASVASSVSSTPIFSSLGALTAPPRMPEARSNRRVVAISNSPPNSLSNMTVPGSKQNLPVGDNTPSSSFPSGVSSVPASKPDSSEPDSSASGSSQPNFSTSCYLHTALLLAPFEDFLLTRMKLTTYRSIQSLPKINEELDKFAFAAATKDSESATKMPVRAKSPCTTNIGSLEDNLAEWGLSFVPTKSQTDSLLHALCVTTGDRRSSQDLRRALVDNLVSIQDIPFDSTSSKTIKSNIDLTRFPSWDSYIASMRKPSAPCDYNMVFAAALLFERQMVVVSSLQNAPPMLVKPNSSLPHWCALHSGVMETHAPIVLGKIHGGSYVGTTIKASWISGNRLNLNQVNLGYMSGDRFNAYAAARCNTHDPDEGNYFCPPTMDTPEKYWSPMWNCNHPRLIGVEYKKLRLKPKNATALEPPYRTHEAYKIKGQRLYSTCDCGNRQSPYQIYLLSKPFAKKYFLPRMTPKRKEALAALVKWCMRCAGFRSDQRKLTRKSPPPPVAPLLNSASGTASAAQTGQNAAASSSSAGALCLAAEFTPMRILKIKESLIGFGVPWQRFAEWARNEESWPKKLLYAMSGKQYPADAKERKKLGPSLRKAGLMFMENAMKEFFTMVPGGARYEPNSSIEPENNNYNGVLTANVKLNSQDHLTMMKSYIGATYAKYIASNGDKGKERTYQEYLDRHDPVEGISSMDDRTSKSKIFVLVYGVIQGANMRRLFGELEEAGKQLDIAQAILNSTNDAANCNVLPKDLALRIKSFGSHDSRLEDGDRSNLQLRVDIIRAQVIRLLHKDIAWKSTRLAHLLQRIKHQTAVMHGYDVMNRFARFQEIMCRLHVAYARVVPSSSSFSRRTDDGVTRSSFPTIKCMTASDEVMLAIKELNFLKKEYDIALETAKETQDTKREPFVWLHRQYVKAELTNWEHKKLRSISPAEALVKWEDMLSERREHLGDGHRHSVYAIRQVVRLRVELDDNLKRAKDLLIIGMRHQKDDKWKKDKLMPLMEELNSKMGSRKRTSSQGRK